MNNLQHLIGGGLSSCNILLLVLLCFCICCSVVFAWPILMVIGMASGAPGSHGQVEEHIANFCSCTIILFLLFLLYCNYSK